MCDMENLFLFSNLSECADFQELAAKSRSNREKSITQDSNGNNAPLNLSDSEKQLIADVICNLYEDFEDGDSPSIGTDISLAEIRLDKNFQSHPKNNKNCESKKSKNNGILLPQRKSSNKLRQINSCTQRCKDKNEEIVNNESNSNSDEAYLPRTDASSESEEKTGPRRPKKEISDTKYNTRFNKLHAYPFVDTPETSAPSGTNMFVSTGENVKKHHCLYCGKFVCKIARHLMTVHKNEEKVKAILKFNANDPTRKKLIEKVRKDGDYRHNVKHNSEKGELVVCRRPNKNKDRKATEYVACPKCFGYFVKNSLRHHFSQCVSREKNFTMYGRRSLLRLSRMVMGRVHEVASAVVRKDIIPMLSDDEIAMRIRYDELVILYANHLADRYSTEDDKKMIRQQLRTLGRFLLELDKLNPDIKDLSGLYLPKHCENCLRAVKMVAGYDEILMTYAAPSNVHRLGTMLKQIGAFLIDLCIDRVDEQKKKLTERFMKLIEGEFQSLNRKASETQAMRKRQRKITLPSADDIQKLTSYLESHRKRAFAALQHQFSYESWLELSETTLLLVQIFNRRQGEISKTLIKEFREHEQLDTNTCGDLYGTLSKECKEVVKEFVRFQVHGKFNRIIPVLLSSEMVKSIELVVQFRKNAEVPAKNPYVFGLPSCIASIDQRLNAYTLMRKYAENCGADLPETLRATTLRKDIATMCMNLSLSKKDITDLMKFLSHFEQIHEVHSERMDTDGQCLDVSKNRTIAKDSEKDRIDIEQTGNSENVFSFAQHNFDSSAMKRTNEPKEESSKKESSKKRKIQRETGRTERLKRRKS